MTVATKEEQASEMYSEVLFMRVLYHSLPEMSSKWSLFWWFFFDLFGYGVSGRFRAVGLLMRQAKPHRHTPV